ncbi:hypothetical protein ACFSLT_01305 [Novosphingobium resinovorum]
MTMLLGFIASMIVRTERHCGLSSDQTGNVTAKRRPRRFLPSPENFSGS